MGIHVHSSLPCTPSKRVSIHHTQGIPSSWQVVHLRCYTGLHGRPLTWRGGQSRDLSSACENTEHRKRDLVYGCEPLLLCLISKNSIPCHCTTIPWNSLFKIRTLTPMLYWEAVASSIAVMLNEASPSMSTTVLFGAATLAPMAAGRPKPIV